MKKRFMVLSVFLVVALMLSLSATVAATTSNIPKDFEVRYNYWPKDYEGVPVYIDYTPRAGIVNAVAYTGVDMTDAEHGYATTSIKHVDGNKATSVGTNVSGEMLFSNLVGINAVPDDIFCIDHYAGQTYNGVIYNWQFHCYNISPN